MKKLRNERFEEIVERIKDAAEVALDGRKVVAGMAAAGMALGLSGCGSEKNNDGLQGFEPGTNMVVDQVRYVPAEGNIKVDLKPNDISFGGRPPKVESVDTKCGTYNGEMVQWSEWDNREGISCHVPKVPSSKRSGVIEYLRTFSADKNETNASNNTDEIVGEAATADVVEVNPLTLGVGDAPK